MNQPEAGGEAFHPLSVDMQSLYMTLSRTVLPDPEPVFPLLPDRRDRNAMFAHVDSKLCILRDRLAGLIAEGGVAVRIMHVIEREHDRLVDFAVDATHLQYWKNFCGFEVSLFCDTAGLLELFTLAVSLACAIRELGAHDMTVRTRQIGQLARIVLDISLRGCSSVVPHIVTMLKLDICNLISDGRRVIPRGIISEREGALSAGVPEETAPGLGELQYETR